MEQRILTLRQNKGLGSARITGIVGRPVSTVHRVLVRHHLNLLDHLDRTTRVPIRRMEMTCSGEHVHLDVKKLGKSPKGRRVEYPQPDRTPFDVPRPQSGHRLRLTPLARRRLQPPGVFGRARGRANHRRHRLLHRAQVFLASHGIAVKRVLTDDGSCYRPKDFARVLGEVAHTFTQPYRPATNGKVERYDRTLLDEWAYARPGPTSLGACYGNARCHWSGVDSAHQ